MVFAVLDIKIFLINIIKKDKMVINDILNKDRLLKYIDLLIIKDENINQNTINEIMLRLEKILNDRRFIARLDNARSNWINIPVNDVITNVILYFNSLETIQV